MNFLKKAKAFFFGTEEEKLEVLDNKDLTANDCWACEKPIAKGEQRTFNGQKFHIKCCRQMIKTAKKDLGFK